MKKSKMTPIALLRELMHANIEVDDYQLVIIFYEEYVRMKLGKVEKAQSAELAKMMADLPDEESHYNPKRR